jgi:hypothetical protein
MKRNEKKPEGSSSKDCSLLWSKGRGDDDAQAGYIPEETTGDTSSFVLIDSCLTA